MQLSVLAWRGLTARPLRTALTAAGVALGVAIVTATLIANQAAADSVERAAAQLLGKADLRVRAFDDAGLTPRAISTLRRLSGVTASAPVAERRLTVSTPPGPDEAVFSVLAIGVDPADEEEVRSYPMVEGGMLPSDASDAVLLNAAWARDRGLGVGSQLLLTGAQPNQPPLRVAGLIDDAGFGALAGGGVLVIPRSTLDAAFAIPAPVRYMDLVVVPGQRDGVQAQLDRSLGEPFVVETLADANRQLGRAQSNFASIAFLFGLVALIVGAFLVANALAMNVGERTREIGLLRAAGATSRQMLAVFLRQGLALGLLGSLAGLLTGILIAALMIGFLRSTHAVLIGGLPLNPLALLLSVSLGMIVTLVGAAVPALQAARYSPLEALRPSRQASAGLWGRLRWLIVLELCVVVAGLVLYPLDRGGTPLVTVALAALLLVGGAVAAALVIGPLARVVGRPFEWFFGAEGMLGRANLGRDRTRSGLTVGALMIALAAVVALASVASSARAGVDRWVDSILPGGYAVRLGLPVGIDDYQPAFEATSGAGRAAPIAEFPAVVRDGQRQTEVSMAGIDPQLFEDAGALIFTAGDRASAFQGMRNGGAVLVPDELSRRDGVTVGDTIALSRPGTAPQPFTVAGVVAYSLPGRTSDGALLVSLADAERIFQVTTASLWSLVPQPEIGAGAFREAVTQTANGLAGEVITAPQLADDLSRSLDRLVGLFDVLALIAVVVGALGIVNTLSAGVAERVREIAVLRAHGMTVGQVQAMVVAEASIIGAVGGVIAVCIGLLVAWAMVAAGASHDFAAGLDVPWALLVSVVLLGTGVAALAGLYPARLAARLPMVASFRQFE
ncbi:MAG TPA: FtsX-like permease family protein [Candidatus Limnocylindria bacterium]|nr:FtsX-like permease family protein [Candidatus Limnocylindria bacterium]